MSDAPSPTPWTPPPDEKKGLKWWQWGLIALAAMTAIAVTAEPESGDESNESQEASKPDNGSAAGAQLVCEDEVRSQLKAPTTAEFSDVEAAKTKGSKYVVNGAVDSENSFGANLRALWICDAEHLHGNSYRVNASILE